MEYVVAAGASSAKVCLQFDINGVILGQETINGKTTPCEQYAAIILANGTQYAWDGVHEESYKDFVWLRAHPGANSDPHLRDLRKVTLKSMVEDLQFSGHTLAPTIAAQRDRIVELLRDTSVFPGVSKLREGLREVPHSFVFRTFGGDGDLVEKYFGDIPFRKGYFDEEGGFHHGDSVTSDPAEIYELLHDGDWIVQDNFQRWRKGGEAGKFGKLFCFSSEDNGYIDVYADDQLNIVDSDEKRTIAACYDIAQKRFVSTQDASRYAFKVNPRDAVLDTEYLLKLVLDAIEIQKKRDSSLKS